MDTGFFDTLRGFKLTSRKHRIADDDFVDRLNHYYTPMIIVVFSIIICAKQYIVGDPLQCWVPAHYHSSWEQYAENYCWVKNTYFVLPKTNIPDQHGERKKMEITYYQWVPFVLALQALMFYAPCVFWRLLNWQSGIHIKNLVQMANDVGLVDPEKRKETVTTLARHIDHAFVTPKSHRPGIAVKIKRVLFRFLCCGDRQAGNYLTVIYLLTKLVYIANIIGQFYLLNSFLGTDYRYYGIDILRDLSAGHEWQHSGHFPRVTLCDFVVRVLGNLQRHTIQCVLVINLFNEKIFIFIWFWMVLIAVVTIISTLAWLIWSLWPGRRVSSVSKYLAKSSLLTDKNRAKRFANEYLRQDGIFLLKMMAFNAGEPIVHDLVVELWKMYKAKEDAEEKELPLHDSTDIPLKSV